MASSKVYVCGQCTSEEEWDDIKNYQLHADEHIKVLGWDCPVTGCPIQNLSNRKADFQKHMTKAHKEHPWAIDPRNNIPKPMRILPRAVRDAREATARQGESATRVTRQATKETGGKRSASTSPGSPKHTTKRQSYSASPARRHRGKTMPVPSGSDGSDESEDEDVTKPIPRVPTRMGHKGKGKTIKLDESVEEEEDTGRAAEPTGTDDCLDSPVTGASTPKGEADGSVTPKPKPSTSKTSPPRPPHTRTEPATTPGLLEQLEEATRSGDEQGRSRIMAEVARALSRAPYFTTDEVLETHPSPTQTTVYPTTTVTMTGTLATIPALTVTSSSAGHVVMSAQHMSSEQGNTETDKFTSDETAQRESSEHSASAGEEDEQAAEESDEESVSGDDEGSVTSEGVVRPGGHTDDLDCGERALIHI